MTTREERAELREWLTYPGDPEGNAPLTRREARGLLDDIDRLTAERDALGERLSLVTGLMGEYFGALRGSWGGIDGRSERQRWWDFRDHLAEGVTDKARLRADLDVCPAGGGHWTEYCYDSCALDGADQ